MIEGNESRCTSCRARIVWARSATTGKAMPIDVEPHADGNIVLRLDPVPEAPKRRQRVAYVIGTRTDYPGPQGGLSPTEPRYRSHFATCPNAAQHRKAAK